VLFSREMDAIFDDFRRLRVFVALAGDSSCCPQLQSPRKLVAHHCDNRVSLLLLPASAYRPCVRRLFGWLRAPSVWLVPGEFSL
jgi:hypothetical protein